MKYAAIAAALFFCVFGLVLIPYTGIGSDEALFATPFFGSVTSHTWGLTGGIPLMVYPYIGSLKSALYWPIWSLFKPTAYSARAPMVALGAITILLFFNLAGKVVNRKAAIIATILLATDPTLILAVTYDWGPVALQFFLTIAGTLAIVSSYAPLGCFCFGLALWNKAIFGWALAGIATAAFLVYRPELKSCFRDKALILRCAGAFLLGVLPLLIYNLQFPNATLRDVEWGWNNVPARLIVLKTTLDGSNLFGVVSAPESTGSPNPPRTIAGQVASRISEWMGPGRSSLMLYGVLGALLLAPYWWHSSGRRVALFSILCFITGFAVMSLVRSSGYVHHVVLLWPLPQLLVGIAVTSVRPRGLALPAAAVLVCANLLVDSQWLVDLERSGSYGLFTDAIYPLSETLSAHGNQKICLTDFGMSDNLNMLTQGRLDLRDCWGALIAPAEIQNREVPDLIADPNVLFVGHIPGLEIQAGVDDRLHSLARKDGRHKRVLQVVQDANRRPVFELFRFE